MTLGEGKRQFPDPKEYTHAETSDYQAAAASLHQALAIFGDLAARTRMNRLATLLTNHPCDE